MLIYNEPFGTTKDGIAVQRYHLVNRDGRRVCVLTYGGIVQMLEAADGHGNVADIVLGFDKLQPYLEEHPYFGAIIGRYANRIAYGRFKLEGKEYQLGSNNGRHHLHGGLHGFDKQVWQAKIQEEADTQSLILSHISKDGEEGFPGTLAVEVKYSWTDSNELRIDYSARTDAPTVLNLTNHSYFNLVGITQQPNILKHRIQLNAHHYLPVDETLIPSGEAEVAGTCMDFLELTEIKNNMDLTHPQIRNANGGYDHAWLLDAGNAASKTLSLAAIVDEPISRRRMKVYTTQPAIQFYTGNFLDGSLIGKNNQRYDKHAGFCMETQHYPDAPNNPEFPSTVLRPGDLYSESTTYQFDVY